MNVKELIKELKKMPQNLPVGVQMGEYCEGEVSGWVYTVLEEEALGYESKVGWTGPDKPPDRMMVILRC